VTPKGICKYVERDLNQKILREANELITMSANGALWSELRQMKVKITFLNEIYMKMITWHNPEVLSWKEKNVRDATFRNLLWTRANLKTVAFKVEELIINFGLKRMRGQLRLFKVIE
jgi:hypothetical protein